MDFSSFLPCHGCCRTFFALAHDRGWGKELHGCGILAQESHKSDCYNGIFTRSSFSLQLEFLKQSRLCSWSGSFGQRSFRIIRNNKIRSRKTAQRRNKYSLGGFQNWEMVEHLHFNIPSFVCSNMRLVGMAVNHMVS